MVPLKTNYNSRRTSDFKLNHRPLQPTSKLNMIKKNISVLLQAAEKQSMWVPFFSTFHSESHLFHVQDQSKTKFNFNLESLLNANPD